MNETTHPTDPLAGAWELVSGFYVGADGAVMNYDNANVKSLKVLAAGKFSFVTSAKGSFYAAGGGDYQVENDLYTEIPILASEASMLGQRFTFQFKLEGNTWTNSRWQEGVLVESEIWRRV
jgi:hypothetical protein